WLRPVRATASTGNCAARRSTGTRRASTASAAGPARRITAQASLWSVTAAAAPSSAGGAPIRNIRSWPDQNSWWPAARSDRPGSTGLSPSGFNAAARARALPARGDTEATGPGSTSSSRVPAPDTGNSPSQGERSIRLATGAPSFAIEEDRMRHLAQEIGAAQMVDEPHRFAMPPPPVPEEGEPEVTVQCRRPADRCDIALVVG